MKPINLNQLLNIVDDDQNIDILFNEKMLWSGKKKQFLDIELGKYFVQSINIEKSTYPVLEIYLEPYISIDWGIYDR